MGHIGPASLIVLYENTAESHLHAGELMGRQQLGIAVVVEQDLLFHLLVNLLRERQNELIPQLTEVKKGVASPALLGIMGYLEVLNPYFAQVTHLKMRRPT